MAYFLTISIFLTKNTTMILKDRNNHDTKIKVLQWVVLPAINPNTKREENTVFAVGLDKNGEITTYHIDSLVGEPDFKE